jgi:RNA polymerase sigma-70 factor, ECF subfamily
MDELTRLLLAAADGDRLALSSFIRRTQADVWRFCAHLVDPQVADDLTQEVYLRAMRSVGGFRGDSTARTWLLTVARRTAADEIRRRQRRRRLPRPVERHEPDHAGHHALRALVAALPDDRREAFVLTQVLGLSYTEAADVAGVPVGTIRSRVARAREQLIHKAGDVPRRTDRADDVAVPAALPDDAAGGGR